jgi:hypothetical protein
MNSSIKHVLSICIGVCIWIQSIFYSNYIFRSAVSFFDVSITLNQYNLITEVLILISLLISVSLCIRFSKMFISDLEYFLINKI